MVSIKTEVLADIDYVEWHNGIPLYGFWCIKIEDDAWLDRLNNVKAAFDPYLQNDYQRFYHITLATVGLMSEDKWHIVQRQIKLLQRSSYKPINLCWQKITSYAHSPIVNAQSLDDGLSTMRETLHLISKGDDLNTFDPHITLGYYTKVVPFDTIQSISEAHNLVDQDNLQVNKIQFCTYQTHSIKGPISTNRVIDLTTT